MPSKRNTGFNTKMDDEGKTFWGNMASKYVIGESPTRVSSCWILPYMEWETAEPAVGYKTAGILFGLINIKD